MKRVLFFTSLLLLPILAMAQGAGGQVKRPVKKQQAETIPPKKKGTKNLSSSCTKPKDYAVELHMYKDKKLSLGQVVGYPSGCRDAMNS